MAAVCETVQVPKNVKDLTGQRFGRLLALSFMGTRKHKSLWLCKCDCGAEKVVICGQLTSRLTQSCGCLKSETSRSVRTAVTTTCDYCGKAIRVKKSQYDRCKHHYCNMTCMAKHRETLCLGERNHQYGLRGALNASFTCDDIPRRNNKLIERMIYVGEWHKDAINGRVKQHRLLVEQNHHLFNPDFFEEIGGWHYLRKGIEVHHIDFNHDNNELANLAPMTKSEHTSLHNKHRVQMRKKGKSIKNDTE